MRTRFHEAVLILKRHEVDFIIVGGVAAVLHGAPISTVDLDIVHERSAANRDRLVAALTEIDAAYRADLTGRKLRPTASILATNGHHLLVSKVGQLDVLGTIGTGELLAYEDLIVHSTEKPLGDVPVRVLDLETLIAIKEKAGRPKDVAVLPVLRQTLALRDGGAGSAPPAR